MTYILGIKKNNVSTIICDTRVSYSKYDGDNTVLKSGFVFPGCMYGASGNVDGFRDFIHYLRHSLSGEYTSKKQIWNNFYKVVTSYKNYPKGKYSFQILFSSNNLGEPQLYLIDSNTEKLEECSNFITLGSGKDILDEKLNEIEKNSRFEKLFTSLQKAQSITDACFPYLYCLYLTELSRGIEFSTLEKYGVGGCFHFNIQDKNTETWQAPAVYLICSVWDKGYNKKKIKIDGFRVTFVDANLVIYDSTINEHHIISDKAANPNIQEIKEKNVEEFIKNIKEKSLSQPKYFYCGVGFQNPQYREFSLHHFTDKDDYIITDDNKLTREAQEKIEFAVRYQDKNFYNKDKSPSQ